MLAHRGRFRTPRRRARSTGRRSRQAPVRRAVCGLPRVGRQRRRGARPDASEAASRSGRHHAPVARRNGHSPSHARAAPAERGRHGRCWSATSARWRVSRTSPAWETPRRAGHSYDKLTCGTCHVVNGQGGTLGPVLTEIGLVRGATHLRQALVEPGAALPIRPLPPSNVPLLKGFTEYLPVRIVTARRARGAGRPRQRRCVHDSGARPGNRFHSFRKSDLKDAREGIRQEPDAQLSGPVTAAELDDLVAYLSGLRGAQ